ncbi:MAG TPA: preprotein translocase subunit YajC [Candidatus Aminicenantes bacterium]|nr:preprotein translocase subunit YajC [Candidatus Aminicenantes bacterium]
MPLFGQTAGGAAQPNMLVSLLPFVVIFVIFYLLIILPARKKQKQHQNLISSLKGGERVLTAGGIYGTVNRVLDDRFEIQVDANTRIQVAKGSISGVIDETPKAR